ncbi:MAG TPA: NAD(P)H-hydrate dehydratase [Opitutus sp.]|nr:NAD(P)H-hydrate dehydratase [Opitutus sp.]
MTTIPSDPILSCAEARELEQKRFAGEEAREWEAMQRAGCAIGAAVLRDCEEIGGFPAEGRVLVLVGKGHNGGDALIAARYILEKFPSATAEVVFAFGERVLRPLAKRAWREVAQMAAERVAAGVAAGLRAESAGRDACRYDVCLDGIFGFQFRPPADAKVAALIERVNALAIRLRAAVDLTSAGLFRADFTYATGAVKSPALEQEAAGRVRYLDLGFFGDDAPGDSRVLTPAVLAPLTGLRPARCDKRSFGHLFVVGGSRSYPGAVLMSALAAVRSGAGLVTVFVPESLQAAYAARLPEAIWVGWPETPDGGLALEGVHLLRERLERADALALGPGIGREKETLALVREIVATVEAPVVLDADALQPDVVRAARAPLVVTPHAGEFERIAGGVALEDFAAETGATVVLKGPVTRIAGRALRLPPVAVEHGGHKARPTTTPVYHSLFGGPVLARGGSGDLLAGMIGAQLAQLPGEPVLAAVRGVVWHGLAAEALARARGQVAVQTTELVDYLPVVLRDL